MVKFLLSAFLLAATSFAAQNTELSAHDRQFVEHAGQLHMTEAHLAQMAQDKARDQSVKDFAQTLERDHTQAYQKLTAIAQRNGFEIPKAIDAQHVREINPFQRLNATGFDQRFKSMQVKDHQKEIAWAQNAEKSLQNADLKAYAAELVDSLQKHLTAAQMLASGASRR